jgi:hypothetical protein
MALRTAVTGQVATGSAPAAHEPLDWGCPVAGAGVLLGPSNDEVWQLVGQRLFVDTDRVVTTDEVSEPGALTHLLWWAPSVRAVLVTADAVAAVEDVRRAIDLTGSDALLLVDAPASCGLATLEQDARWADLVVMTTPGRAADPRPASLLSWSPRLARELELLDGMHPLSYDVLSRFHGMLA